MAPKGATGAHDKQDPQREEHHNSAESTNGGHPSATRPRLGRARTVSAKTRLIQIHGPVEGERRIVQHWRRQAAENAVFYQQNRARVHELLASRESLRLAQRARGLPVQAPNRRERQWQVYAQTNARAQERQHDSQHEHKKAAADESTDSEEDDAVETSDGGDADDSESEDESGSQQPTQQREPQSNE